MSGVTRAAALVAGAALVVACARMGDPPGGPQDLTPPTLLATRPDSLRIIPGFKGTVEFIFNETVSEGSSPNFGLGSGDLEKLILVSPTRKIPAVQWHRSRITVKPREGWLPNRVYRVELLPGIVDLRTNRAKTGRIITFTTGAPIPTAHLDGRVIDWGTRRPEPQAVVEAVLLPDSLPYRSITDSLGRFSLGPLPTGEYIVYGVLDQNKNHRYDNRESFDTVHVAATRDSVGDLWAFKHDTVSARIAQVTAVDSLSVSVSFNQQLDPYQTFSKDSVRVRQLPDSADVPVELITTKEKFDSLYTRTPPKDSTKADTSAAVRDSVAKVKAHADSVARADSILRARNLAREARRRPRGAVPVDTAGHGPVLTRPELFDRVVIRLAQPLKPGAKYVVELKGIRSVSRVVGHATQGFAVPEEKKPPPDSLKADSLKADSLKKTVPDTAKAKARRVAPAKPDSTPAPARPDSIRPARPDSAVKPRRLRR